MKRLFIVAIAVACLCLSIPALAADVLLQAPVEKAETLLDKNGAEYVRLVINETRHLNGIEYETETLVMAFGSQVEFAKQIKAGENLKAIANKRIYEDNISYTILKVLE